MLKHHHNVVSWKSKNRMQDVGALADFISLLREHQKSCEAAGKYIEADIAKKRLEEV